MAVLYCLSGEDARRARKRTGVGRDGEGRVRSRVGKEGACGEGEVKAGPVREATHWIVGLARRGDRCGTGQPGCRRRQTRETASRRRTSTNWLLVNCVVSAVLPTPPSPSIVRRCSTGGRRAQEDDKSQREREHGSAGGGPDDEQSRKAGLTAAASCLATVAHREIERGRLRSRGGFRREEARRDGRAAVALAAKGRRASGGQSDIPMRGRPMLLSAGGLTSDDGKGGKGSRGGGAAAVDVGGQPAPPAKSRRRPTGPGPARNVDQRLARVPETPAAA